MFKGSLIGALAIAALALMTLWSPLPESIWRIGFACLLVNTLIVIFSFQLPELGDAHLRSWVRDAARLGLRGWKRLGLLATAAGMALALGLGLRAIRNGIPDMEGGVPVRVAPKAAAVPLDWPVYQRLRGHQQRVFLATLYLFALAHAGAYATLAARSRELAE